MGSEATHHTAIRRTLREEPEYPPTGSKNACLVLVLNSEQFLVLGHTGRYFHGQITCAGYQGEEIGIENVPDNHGYWVMNHCTVNGGGQDYFGEWDDASISGTWRAATIEDFGEFGVDLPAGFAPPSAATVVATEPLFVEPVARYPQDQSFYAEGNNGGSFVQLETDSEIEGRVVISVGASCVYTWDSELVTVEGLAELLSCAKHYGSKRLLRESGIAQVDIERMFPSS